MDTINVKKGVNLHIIKTDKFKTNYMGFNFHRPLTEEEATVNSLLSCVLPRGCEMYPETRALRLRQEELFGVELSSVVKKRGDSQLFCVGFEFANENYIGEKQPIFEGVCQLARQIIFEQKAFNPEYVRQEKENLKSRILAIMNDKRQYAQIRLTQLMCKNEPYGLAEYGEVHRIDDIDCELLEQQYKNKLLNSVLDIFIIGDVDRETAIRSINNMTDKMNCKTDSYPETMVISKVDSVNDIIEEERINQGKLALGFRTGIAAKDDDYMPLVIYNGIFGGGPYSKLFNNVREKMSLAYYVSSRLDKFKGIMQVNAGIEISNKQIAFDAILEQEQAVKNGHFTDLELEAAQLGTANAVRSMGDSQRMMEDFYISELICGTGNTIDGFADSIMSVTKEQVVRVAQNLKLDTTYFLTGKE